jgi:hypothetical protein
MPIAFVFALLLASLSATPASGADFEYRGKIEARDHVSRLLAYYVDEFTPEELFLSGDGQPDDSGRVRDLYMDLTGVPIGGVRVDKLVFRMNDAQFNPPSEWASGSVECKSALQIYAYCLLKEDDVNRHLAAKTIGRDDHWSRISMKISPAGLYARGTYSAKVLFVTLNIYIEVESGLKIVDNKTLWLDEYKARVNRLDIPAYITKKAVEQIQPLLDMGRFPLPLKLHSVKLENGRAALSTRIPPTPLPGGITYQYRAE